MISTPIDAGACPGVSVIIPAYNYGRYLRESVQSVLDQDYSEFEVVVVDDGSTDDTRRIVEVFSTPRVRYIYQTNSGLSAARNTGIKNARFPFLAFLDADDTWRPTMLSTVMERFRTLPKEVGLVACASARVTAAGAALAGRKLAPMGDCYLEERDIVLRSRFMPSAVVVRSAVFETCGSFDTTLRSSEDRDMWIRIARQFKLFHVDTPMVLIRRHGENMSSAADRMHLNMGRVLKSSWDSGGGVARYSPTWLQVASLYYFEYAWMLHDERRHWKAARNAVLSLLVCPFVPDRKRLNEPILFRVRGLARFLAASLRGGGRRESRGAGCVPNGNRTDTNAH